MSEKSFRRVLLQVLCASVLLLPLPAADLWAQAHPNGTALKRDDGEEEHVQQRREWFFSTRRAGATKRLSDLRLKAVDFTRKAMQAQRSLGTDAQGGGWICRGPASSNFSNWKFGKVSGRTIALARDWARNILYAGGASGGLWKSTDDGQTWTSLFDTVGTTTIGVITLDPSNPNVIWTGTGENSSWCEEYFGVGLLRSLDGGMTWEARNGSGAATLENLSAFASVVVDPRDPNHLVVGGRYSDCVNGNYYWGGLYTSNDAGLTWTCRIPHAGITEIVQDPVNRDVFWAGAENAGLYRSADNGVSWSLQTASALPTGSTGRVEVAVSPADPSTVYALFADVGYTYTPEFWRTTNGGGAWTRMSQGAEACDGQCDYNMVLRAHLTDPNTIYRGTVHIFKSVNGGAVWQDLSGQWGPQQKIHQDTHIFEMSPTDANLFYVGCDGGVWKTSDGGRTFTNLNANLVMTQFYAVGIHPTDDSILVGGSQDNSSLARTGGDTWDMQEMTGDGFISLINPSNTNIVYAASYPWDTPAVLRSSTGIFGPYTYITAKKNGFTSGDRINWVTPYAYDPTQPSTLFLGTQRMYRTGNGGSTWTKVGPEDMTLGGTYDSIACVEINASDGAHVWAGTTDGKIWTTADGGATWADTSAGLPQRAVNDIAGNPGDPAGALCVVGGFGTPHVWASTPSGWTARGGGLPDVPVNTVLMISASEVYVGTDVGVYHSSDGGATFFPFMSGLPMGVVVTDLKFNPSTRTLTAGTYGRGVWQHSPVPHDRPLEKP